jgi:hypothetical protein
VHAFNMSSSKPLAMFEQCMWWNSLSLFFFPFFSLILVSNLSKFHRNLSNFFSLDLVHILSIFFNLNYLIEVKYVFNFILLYFFSLSDLFIICLLLFNLFEIIFKIHFFTIFSSFIFYCYFFYLTKFLNWYFFYFTLQH